MNEELEPPIPRSVADHVARLGYQCPRVWFAFSSICYWEWVSCWAYLHSVHPISYEASRHGWNSVLAVRPFCDHCRLSNLSMLLWMLYGFYGRSRSCVWWVRLQIRCSGKESITNDRIDFLYIYFLYIDFLYYRASHKYQSCHVFWFIYH